MWKSFHQEPGQGVRQLAVCRRGSCREGPKANTFMAPGCVWTQPEVTTSGHQSSKSIVPSQMITFPMMCCVGLRILWFEDWVSRAGLRLDTLPLLAGQAWASSSTFLDFHSKEMILIAIACKVCLKTEWDDAKLFPFHNICYVKAFLKTHVSLQEHLQEFVQEWAFVTMVSMHPLTAGIWVWDPTVLLIPVCC